MIQSDDWMVNYAGYEKIISIYEKGEGRGIFSSVKAKSLVVVINADVFVLSVFSVGPTGVKKFNRRKIGQLETNVGEVFIDENNTSQIAICDQQKLYIWNYSTDSFTIATLPVDVVPGYVTYQNTRFVIPDTKTGSWYASKEGDGLNWFPAPGGLPYQGAIQTKSDLGKVTVRFPGRSDLLFVMGETVSELYVDVGSPVFPYKKNTSISFDYGCVSPSTVATSEDFIVWLGTNERSEPVIMFSTGSQLNTISTDGINNKLQRINNPSKSTAFLVKILGHLIYQLTFFDPKDNFTLLYDFTTSKFYDATDENMNYHIIRDVAFFDGDYYFVSLNDGNIYLLNSDLYTYNYGINSLGNKIEYDISRIRVCSNFRLPTTDRFIVKNLTFMMQQGDDVRNQIDNPSYRPRIDLSISYDGGITFGSYVSTKLNYRANRINQIDFYKLGSGNDFVAQFRFHTKGPVNVFNGVMEIKR
jgi:hypothetical protein